MRMRALLRMMLLGTVAVLPPVLLHAPALHAAAAEIERQSGALPAIKGAILKATGYADATVTLALRANQFWVSDRKQSSQRRHGAATRGAGGADRRRDCRLR